MKNVTLLIILVSALVSTNCSKQKCEENRKPDCLCTAEYNPVCGCNGITYGNSCEANCAGIEDYVEGACSK